MTLANAVSSHESPAAASKEDVRAPDSNTEAVLTYAAAGAEISHCVGQVAYSYDGAPTNGNLKIEDGSGNTIFSADVTDAGPDVVTFKPPKKGTANRALIITLSAGGSSKTGKLSATHWTE